MNILKASPSHPSGPKKIIPKRRGYSNSAAPEKANPASPAYEALSHGNSRLTQWTHNHSNGSSEFNNQRKGNVISFNQYEDVTTTAKVICTPQKPAIDHQKFLMKIKQGKCARKKDGMETISVSRP